MIVWRDNLLIGIDKLDNQHKQLVALINKLEESDAKSKNVVDVIKVFIQLEEYVHFHFTDEENVMEKLNYPELNKQQQMHQDFCVKLEKFKLEFSDGAIEGTHKGLWLFLNNWFINHICKEDKKISEFINA
ncbi:MAG: hemerythrin family protein [Methylococcales bacterium]|jgi:hemerythrin-like metal-binding protein|nr:hemerythrin family protein [Methylococcales bacterium]MBT7408126.1 hemerythrin family protein [Methylococcales bacterium]